MLVTSVGRNYLLALDIETGKKVWEVPFSSSMWDSPNITILGDVVVIGAWGAYTNSYVAGYQLSTGDLVWELHFPAKSYQFSFECSSISSKTNEQALCLLVNNRLIIVDPGILLSSTISRTIGIERWDIISHNTPYFQSNILFTNPYLKPANQAFDLLENNRFSLPTYCSENREAYPVTNYNNQILVSTGCNELYVLNLNNLNGQPDWVHQSQDALLSSFVTTNGKVGYVLNDKGEILGVNLNTGSIVGKFVTQPNELEKGQFVNSLVAHPPYLYVLLDRNNLYVFKQQP